MIITAFSNTKTQNGEVSNFYSKTPLFRPPLVLINLKFGLIGRVVSILGYVLLDLLSDPDLEKERRLLKTLWEKKEKKMFSTHPKTKHSSQNKVYYQSCIYFFHL